VEEVQYVSRLGKGPGWEGHGPKRRVRKAANGICGCCKCENWDGEVHHIDFNPMNNVLTNLIYLCKNCHRKIHAPHVLEITTTTST